MSFTNLCLSFSNLNFCLQQVSKPYKTQLIFRTTFCPNQNPLDDISHSLNNFNMYCQFSKLLPKLFSSNLYPDSFYYYSMKRDKIKFRKRSNIFFSSNYKMLTYFTNVELLLTLRVLSQVFSVLRGNYKLKVGFLSYIKYKRNNAIKLYFLNLHYALSFLNNTNFKSNFIITGFVIEHIPSNLSCFLED